jgi:hypothetical protein
VNDPLVCLGFIVVPGPVGFRDTVAEIVKSSLHPSQ